jgi:hypothetical protein
MNTPETEQLNLTSVPRALARRVRADARRHGVGLSEVGSAILRRFYAMHAYERDEVFARCVRKTVGRPI